MMTNVSETHRNVKRVHGIYYIEYLHVLFRFIIARLREEYNKCVELPLYHNIIDWSFSWFCRIRMSPPARKCTHCGGWSRRRTPPFRGTITLRSNCWSWSSRAPSVYANSLMGILPLRLWVEEDWLVEQQLEHLWETWAYLLQAWLGMEFWVSLHLLLLERLLHPHHHLHLPHHFLQKVRSHVWCAISYCCLTRRSEILRTHLIWRTDKEKFRFGTSTSPLSMQNRYVRVRSKLKIMESYCCVS